MLRRSLARGLQLRRSIISQPICKRSMASSSWDELQAALARDPSRVIVLDDDPTGCQTVHGIEVLLDYSTPTLTQQLSKDDKLFFVLTNSRSLAEQEAIAVTQQVMHNLNQAVAQIGYPKPLHIISRGDSTLRGHYPAETNAISSTGGFRGTVLCPAFFDGGRVTRDDIHYMKEGDQLVPVAGTAFAQDAHFGYKSSHLGSWAMEKNPAVSTLQIVSIALEDVRNVDKVAAKLIGAPIDAVVVVNAMNQDDLNYFTIGLLQAEAQGVRFVCRTAASFVSSRAGIPPKPLLQAADLLPANCNTGGLIVVGSYVPKSTAQLAYLLSSMSISPVQLDLTALSSVFQSLTAATDLDQLLTQPLLTQYIHQTAGSIRELLLAKKDVVFFTPRDFQKHFTLQHIALVSRLVTAIVASIHVQPRFIIAKGGITSHDVAQKSLQIQSALVLGQLLPGVPVWKANQQDLIYVVFPGNVGDDQALAKAAETLGVARKGAAPLVFNSKSTMLQVLQAAEDSKQAIAAFNVYNLEGAKAVISAAEKLQHPVILQLHPSSLQFGQQPLLQMLRAFKQHASVSVFLHLDHCTDRASMEMALQGGVDSIMVDGSDLPFEENLRWTKQLAEWIHSEGALVEAELGKLAGEEDGLAVDERDARMTDPVQAARFFKETGVDLLAVTIGNVHGKYKLPPALDIPRLQAIIRNLDGAGARRAPYLVLHGASGLHSQHIQTCLANRIVKFNVNTDLRAAAMAFYRQAVQDPKADVLQLMQGSTAAMQVVAEEKISLFRGQVANVR